VRAHFLSIGGETGNEAGFGVKKWVFIGSFDDFMHSTPAARIEEGFPCFKRGRVMLAAAAGL
jgi:hypothetical protein